MLKMAANEEVDACDNWEELEDSGVRIWTNTTYVPIAF